MPAPLRPKDWNWSTCTRSPAQLGLHPERAFNLADRAGRCINGTFHCIKINQLQKYDDLQDGILTFEEAVFAEPIENLQDSKLCPNPTWLDLDHGSSYGSRSNGPWQIDNTVWKIHNRNYYHTELVKMKRYDDLRKGVISLQDAVDAEPIENFKDSYMAHQTKS